LLLLAVAQVAEAPPLIKVEEEEDLDIKIIIL
jgi:hypothetical protein